MSRCASRICARISSLRMTTGTVGREVSDMLVRSFAVESEAAGCLAPATCPTLGSMIMDEAGAKGAATDLEEAGADGEDAAGRGAATDAAAGAAVAGAAGRAVEAGDDGG